MPTRKRRSISSLSYLALLLFGCLVGVIWTLRARASHSMAYISGKRMSVEDVRRMIDTDIPVGSSKNQIEAWFKSRGIRYGYLDAKRGQLKHQPLAKQSGVPVKDLSGILTAVVPGYSGKIIKCHTYMAFIIDKDGRLVKRHVSGACTNPIDRIENFSDLTSSTNHYATTPCRLDYAMASWRGRRQCAVACI